MSGQSEWASSVDSLEQRVYTHLPPSEIFNRPIIDEEVEAREIHREKFQGADFELVTRKGKFYFVPSWHRWNAVAPHSKGVNYAKGVIDGGSFRAAVDPNDPTRIDHGNIVLADARNKRYVSSWRALGYEVAGQEMSQSIYDLCTILGEGVLRDSEEMPTRAYIRPHGVVSEIGTGVGTSDIDEIFHGLYIRNFPSYFPGKEGRIYQSEGLYTTVFLDQQRLEPIPGKLTRNYPLVGDLTKRAKVLSDDEAIILAPHGYDPSSKKIKRVFAQDGDDALELMLKYQHFADGPGQGLIAVKEHSGFVEVWFPPDSVNQLISTTMMYNRHYMVPGMGFRVVERPFGFYEIRKGLVDNILMVGNAVGVVPVGRIRVIHPARGEIEIIQMDISNAAKRLRNQYAAEIDELIPPSHPSLITRVDLHSPQAQKAREILYNAWEKYF